MYDIVKEICQPYLWLMVILGTTIFLIRRRELPRGAWGVMFIAWSGILLLSLPIVGYLLIGTLEWHFPPPKQLPGDADVIVTLGGGVSPPTAFRDTAEVTGSSYGRCLHTIGLYRALKRPKVILCGGRTEGAEFASEADVMRTMLLRFDVRDEDILVEQNSQNTFENTLNACQTLREGGFQKPILVTAARHMLRSASCFRKQGVSVLPSPSSYKSDGVTVPFYEMLIPNPAALSTSHTAIQEWIGLCYYRLRGRI